MDNVEWALAIKTRDSWKCANCVHTFHERALHAHHIIPQALGGENTLENGITLCTRCHGKEHRGEMSTSALMKVNINPPKGKRPAGRKTRHHAKEIIELTDITQEVLRQTILALTEALGQTDPLVFHQQFKIALSLMVEAQEAISAAEKSANTIHNIATAAVNREKRRKRIKRLAKKRGK